MNEVLIFNTDINSDTSSTSLDTSSSISLNESSSTSRNRNNTPVNTDRGTVTETEDYDLLAAETPEGCKSYVAKKGDTFASIATLNNVDVENLKSINYKIQGEISEGDIVYIPMEELDMDPTEAGGGGGGSSSLDADVPSSSGGGGGGGGSSAPTAGANSDTPKTSPKGGGSDDKPNNDPSKSARGTLPGSSKYSHSTSDLRSLNLSELDEIAANYKASAKELRDRLSQLELERDSILKDALAWYDANKDHLDKNLSEEQIFDLYLKNNSSAIKTYEKYSDYTNEINRINDELNTINEDSKQLYIVMLQKVQTEKSNLETEYNNLKTKAIQWYETNKPQLENDNEETIINTYLKQFGDDYSYRTYREYQTKINDYGTKIDNITAIIINYTCGYDNPEDGLLAMYKNTYTDEVIDQLDIDQKYKDMIKKCLNNNDDASLILVASIVSDLKQIENIDNQIEELERQSNSIYIDYDGRGSYAQEQIKSATAQKEELQNQINQLKNQKKALNVEIKSLENNLTLMQYSEYYKDISDTEIETDSATYFKEFFADNPDLLNALKESGYFESTKADMNGNPTDEEVAAAVILYCFDNTDFSRAPGDPNFNDYSYILFSSTGTVNGPIDINIMALMENYSKYFGDPNNDSMHMFLSIDPGESAALKYFTVEERNVYNRIFKEQGGLAAYQYVMDMQDTINQRWAYDLSKDYFESVINNPSEFKRLLSEGWIGLQQGLRGHFENVIALLTGDDSMTITEYATQYFLQFMANAYSVAELGEIDSKKLDELYNQTETINGEEYRFINEEQYSKLKKILEKNGSLNGYDILYVKEAISEEDYNYSTEIYNNDYYKTFMETYGGDSEQFWANCVFSAGNSIGNMLPSIMLSIMCQPLGAACTIGSTTITWGQIAANASMFLSATGGAWKEASREGNGQFESLLYGILNGASEVGVGFLLGRVPFVSRVSKVTEDLAAGQGNILLKAGLSILSDIFGEVTEEVSQIFIEGGLKKIILNDDKVTWESLFKQIPETIVSTIISTGVMNGTVTVIQLGGLAVSIGPEDAINMFLAKNSEAFLQALIAAKTDNINILKEIIDSDNISEREKALVISRLSDDNQKIDLLSKLKDSAAIDGVVLSLKDDNAKLKAMEFASEEVKTYLADSIDTNKLSAETIKEIVQNDDILQYFNSDAKQSMLSKLGREELLMYLADRGIAIVDPDDTSFYTIDMNAAKNNKALELADIVISLRATSPNEDILTSDGQVLFLADYDYVNTTVVYDIVTTSNTSLTEINCIDVIAGIRNMEAAGYTKEDIIHYIDSVDNARKMILENDVVSCDEIISQADAVKILGEVFKDNNPVAMAVMSQMYGLSGDQIKEAILKSKQFSEEEVEEFFSSVAGQYILSLLPEEIDAISSYCGAGYTPMNGYMRGDQRYITPQIAQQVNNLRSALQKYPGISQPMLLYRGDTISFVKCSPELAAIFDGIGKYDNPAILSAFQSAVGYQITTDNFLSCSPSYQCSFATSSAKNVVLEIMAPPGTPGAYVNMMGIYNLENEFLLMDGLDMTIINAYIGGDGKVHVQLTVDSTANTRNTVDLDTIRALKTDTDRLNYIKTIKDNETKIKALRYLSYSDALSYDGEKIIFSIGDISDKDIRTKIKEISEALPDYSIVSVEDLVLYDAATKTINDHTIDTVELVIELVDSGAVAENPSTKNIEIDPALLGTTTLKDAVNAILDVNTDADIYTSDGTKIYDSTTGKITLPIELSDNAKAINDRINNAAAGFEVSKYYELLNILYEYQEKGMKVPVDDIVDVINSNQELRVSLVAGAREAITNLLTACGYTGDTTSITDQLLNMLTGGDTFINGRLGDGIDWQGFINLLRGDFKKQLETLVAEGKVPIVWSSINNDNHSTMNEQYATIENTTIGEELANLLDALFPNWDGVGSPRQVEIWEMLSEVYAEELNELKDPATGEPYTNIQFVYPSDKEMDQSFGELFKTVEFPILLKNGNVNTLTLVKVNQETMEVLEKVEVDISDIVEFYQNGLTSTVQDPELNNKAVEMLIKKIQDGDYTTTYSLEQQMKDTSHYVHLDENKVIINESDLENYNEYYDLGETVDLLRKMYPGQEIYLEDRLIYDPEFDLLDEVAVYGVNFHDNVDIETLADIDIMDKVQEMKAAGVPREQIESYIAAMQRALAILRNNPDNFAGFDAELDQDDTVEALNDIFQDGSKIAGVISALIRFGTYSVEKIKKELLTYYPTSFTQEEIDDFFNNNPAGQYLNTLTTDEIWAINKYTTGDFTQINEYFRGNIKGTPEIIKIAENLKSAIAKYHLQQAVYLYRGDTIDFTKCNETLTNLISGLGSNPTPQQIVAALQAAIGIDITTQNVLSTSPGYNTSFAYKDNYPVVLEILAPPGTNGAYLNMEASQFYNNENEFLLADQTNMTILNVYYDETGDKKIHVQMVVNPN